MTFATLLLALQLADSVTSAGRDDRPRAPVRAPRPLIVVDAGHGGPDRGMSGTTAAREGLEADYSGHREKAEGGADRARHGRAHDAQHGHVDRPA